MPMKTYLLVVLCMAGQTVLSTQVLAQNDVNVASLPPVSVNVQNVSISGLNILLIAARNNSHSPLTLDKAALQAPGFSITKEIGRSGGNIQELCWGYSPLSSGRTDANPIWYDFKRPVSVLPGGELKIRIETAKLLAHVPPDFRGAVVHIRLEFPNLILASSVSGTALFTNTIELRLGIADLSR